MAKRWCESCNSEIPEDKKSCPNCDERNKHLTVPIGKNEAFAIEQKSIMELHRKGFEKFSGAMDLKNIVDLAKDIAIAPPQYVLFPSKIDKRYVQKLILNMRTMDFDHHKKKGSYQYVMWPAYSLLMYYHDRIIPDRTPFIFKVPFRSFTAMWARGIGLPFHTWLQQLQREFGDMIPFVEIHFRKKTEKLYELLFLGLIVPKEIRKDEYRWRRIRIYYQNEKYYPKDIEVITHEES